MPFCKRCGTPIEKPYKYCRDCIELKGKDLRLYRKLSEAVDRARMKASLSGNPKVYTAGECSQAFLQSLIPKRI